MDGTGKFSSAKMQRMCGAVGMSDQAGGLAKLSDLQVTNGVCELSAITVELISRHQDTSDCQDALVRLGKEYKRRFPSADVAELGHTCRE